MTLWLILAALILGVVALLLYPVLRKRPVAAQRMDYDIAVYRDQLAEVEKDAERELVTAEQAEASRAEIYRRILAADDAKNTTPTTETKSTNSVRSKIILAAIIFVLLPAGSLYSYLRLGAPGLPAQPYAERKNNPDFVLAIEAEQLAAHLEAKPDAEGYKALADTYFMLRRYGQAAEAYQKVIALNGGSPSIWSEFGEAITMDQSGMVTPEARKAFTKALKLDHKDARSRFYLGLAETQINELRRAVAIWRDLEKDSNPDSPWLAMLQEHIVRFAKQGDFDPQLIPPAPPSATPSHNTEVDETSPTTSVDPSAAAAIMAMEPSAQKDMIHTMVERLAAKMKKNPNDIDGWLRLAKAYRVLGETEKAMAAENKAKALKAKEQ